MTQMLIQTYFYTKLPFIKHKVLFNPSFKRKFKWSFFYFIQESQKIIDCVTLEASKWSKIISTIIRKNTRDIIIVLVCIHTGKIITIIIT